MTNPDSFVPPPPQPKSEEIIGGVIESPDKVPVTRRHNKVLYLAGEGVPKPKVMFVATSVFESETQEKFLTHQGVEIKLKARMLNGAVGAIFKDSASLY